VIVEATYGVSQHEPRQEREQRFVDRLRQVVSRGGRALLPVVALGRAQVHTIPWLTPAIGCKPNSTGARAIGGRTSVCPGGGCLGSVVALSSQAVECRRLP